MGKHTGKVGEFCQSGKVRTMILLKYLLLKAGADADINTFHSLLTFPRVSCCGSTKIIGILVKAGANVNDRNFY